MCVRYTELHRKQTIVQNYFCLQRIFCHRLIFFDEESHFDHFQIFIDFWTESNQNPARIRQESSQNLAGIRSDSSQIPTRFQSDSSQIPARFESDSIQILVSLKKLVNLIVQIQFSQFRLLLNTIQIQISLE